MSRLLALFLIVSSLAITTGCGLLPDVAESEYDGKNAAQIYTIGISYRRAGDFPKAIESFTQLETLFPFDPYAQQGMLEMAYSQYRQEEHVNAILTLTRFVEQNPIHENIAYAHYLTGIVYFDYGQSLLHYILPYVRHNKDPSPWKAAFNSFNWVVTNDPGSRYAVDAQKRTVFLRNLLARYELHVADFYLRRKAYIAVINRSQYVLQRYHGSPYMADALWYLEQAHRKLEIHDLADNAYQVRQLNFPQFDAQKAEDEAVEAGIFATSGEWVSAGADGLATLVGFDIAELPPENLSGHYKITRLELGEGEEYSAAKEPEKVVASEVQSGYLPNPEEADADAWYRLKELLGLTDEYIPAVPPAPAEEVAEEQPELKPELGTIDEPVAEPEQTPVSDPPPEL